MIEFLSDNETTLDCKTGTTSKFECKMRAANKTHYNLLFTVSESNWLGHGCVGRSSRVWMLKE